MQSVIKINKLMHKHNIVCPVPDTVVVEGGGVLISLIGMIVILIHIINVDDL